MSSTSAESLGHTPHLAHHFKSIEQQEESATMGMWLFLAQEVMFFGGMFVAYGVLRFKFHDAFVAGSHALDWRIGAFNTTLLLMSSYCMAMAVYFTQVGDTKNLIRRLWMVLGLGIAFVVVKLVFEWYPKLEHGVVPGALWNPTATHHHYGELAAFPDQGPVQLFYWLYFVMTGMHALHMLIGFGILIPIIYYAYKGHYGPARFMTILNFGLYWHFVDIVWVFLYPLYYLVA